jgi:hypothetical protein
MIVSVINTQFVFCSEKRTYGIHGYYGQDDDELVSTSVRPSATVSTSAASNISANTMERADDVDYVRSSKTNIASSGSRSNGYTAVTDDEKWPSTNTFPAAKSVTDDKVVPSHESHVADHSKVCRSCSSYHGSIFKPID